MNQFHTLPHTFSTPNPFIFDPLLGNVNSHNLCREVLTSAADVNTAVIEAVTFAVLLPSQISHLHCYWERIRCKQSPHTSYDNGMPLHKTAVRGELFANEVLLAEPEVPSALSAFQAVSTRPGP